MIANGLKEIGFSDGNPPDVLTRKPMKKGPSFTWLDVTVAVLCVALLVIGGHIILGWFDNDGGPR